MFPSCIKQSITSISFSGWDDWGSSSEPRDGPDAEAVEEGSAGGGGGGGGGGIVDEEGDCGKGGQVCSAVGKVNEGGSKISCRVIVSSSSNVLPDSEESISSSYTGVLMQDLEIFPVT